MGFYGTGGNVFREYSRILDGTGIRVFRVGDRSLNLTLGRCLDEAADDDSEHEAFRKAYVLVQGMDHGELTEILMRFESEHAGFDGIRVMRTAQNEMKAVREVLAEEAGKNALPRRIMILRQILHQCETLDMDSVPEEIRKRLQQALMQAYMIIGFRNYDEMQIEYCIQEIMTCLRYSGGEG